MLKGACLTLLASSASGYQLSQVRAPGASTVRASPISVAVADAGLSRAALPTMVAADAPPVQHATGSDSGKKKIFVLGGDGFCGWPTALHLSDKGHDVVIIDNLSRRKIDVELGCDSLTPITSPEVRVATWNELTGRNLRFEYMDVAQEYDRFCQLIKDEKPDTMVHFAEQRAAPYSMKNSATKRYTIENNLGASHNAVCAIVDSGVDVHLVHLGTMGVYGYGNSGGQIPEVRTSRARGTAHFRRSAAREPEASSLPHVQWD